MNPSFKSYLLKATDATNCEESEIIQSLWSGYGQISRYHLEGSAFGTVVVKFISLTQAKQHPRGWNTNRSHDRKVRSYEVETHWYQKWSRHCISCKIPILIGSYAQGNDMWIVLEDLKNEFLVRKYQVNIDEVKLCLKWLASFHSNFLNHKPEGLWKVGTYWHLATRPDEFEKIENQKLKSKANIIDSMLNECKFQTIVHGDAKLANFCFSKDGKSVAAVDFQYVGGGCGMKDVAYFLGSCLSSSDLEVYETALLNCYFQELKLSVLDREIDVDVIELEAEWRKMYPLACTDFTRFLLGWMPSHQKVNRYNLNIMESVLSKL